MEDIWRIRPIKRRPTRPHFKIDIDSDGVVDWRDCRPFNRRLQHLSKSLPVNTPQEVKETYNTVLNDAYRIYGSKDRAIRFANEVIKAKVKSKTYAYHDVKDMMQTYNVPGYSFRTSTILGPFGSLMEGYDEAHDVYFYADITKLQNELLVFKLDEHYVKSNVPKKVNVLLLVTGIDREILGRSGVTKLLNYATGK